MMSSWKLAGHLRSIVRSTNVAAMIRFGVQRTVASSVPEPESAAIKPEKDAHAQTGFTINPDIRFGYPEFLPNPWPIHRNAIREKLERQDMINRRTHVNIPIFFVGSIVAVTQANSHSPEKTGRFLGICIRKENPGLRASFLLRNVIDDTAVEILYYMYDPTILRIDVLRLEKRLDTDLLYLRDSLLEYSTFPQDMEPEFLAEGAEVPLNPIQVKLNPRPWRIRYERKDYKGIQDIPVTNRMKRIGAALKKPWVKYDLMKTYRSTIPEEEQREIFSEVYSDLQKQEIVRKKIRRRTQFVPPKKSG